MVDLGEKHESFFNNSRNKNMKDLYSNFVVKWKLSGDHTVAVCQQCGQEIRRGKVGSPKKECGNRGMQQHLERVHREALAGVQEARARSAAEAAGKTYDSKGGGNKRKHRGWKLKIIWNVKSRVYWENYEQFTKALFFNKGLTRVWRESVLSLVVK